MEAALVAVLSTLFPGQVWPDVGPPGAAVPFCTYQQVGGAPVNAFCGDAQAENAIVQITVWSKSRVQTNTLMRQVASAVTGTPLRGTSMGGFTAIHNEDTDLRGAFQDFSFWR